MGGKEDKKIKGQVPLLEQNATNSSGAVSTRRTPSRRSFWLCCFRPESEQVRELDYRHLSLQDVPTEIFNYERTLEELYLDCNQIVDLPRPLFHCHSLRRLNLSDNEIQAIPPAVASLIHLQELDVSKNSLGEFPDNIKCCKQLRLLDASVNPLCKLPEGATQLLCLEELYLSDTFLEFLPANFGRLNKLRILELRENQLSSLPKSMARLTSLTRLDIGQNDFNELPEVVGSLLVLEELWCDCNKLSNLPEFLGQLKKLTHLDASKNYLEELPASLNDCIALKDLSLSANNLSCLPVIHGLKSLVVLRLDDNRLTCLPDSLGQCSSLEELQVGQNRLKSLPPAIGLLRKLHALYVDENQLEQLPPELGSCTALTVLSARRNALMSIPAELGHLSKLRVLNLSGNRLLNLPVSLLNLPALLALWLSESQNKPLIPLQTEKDPGTGNKVLTCFLLPQTSSEPDWGNIAKGEDETEFLLDHWEEQRQARMQIKFASDGEPDLLDSKLARNPTPYPKELKALAKHAHNIASKHSTTHEGDKDRSSITGTSKDNKDVGSSEVASSVSAEEAPNRRKEAIKGSSPVVIKEAKQIAIPRVTEKVSELPSSVVPKPLGEVPVTTSSVVVEEEPRVPPPYHVAAAYSKHAEKFNQPESLASTPVTTEPVANFLPKSTASPVWEKSFTASLPASPSSHLLPINDVNTPLSTPTSTNIIAPAVGMSNEQFLNSDQSESMTSESPSPGSQSPCEELDHVSLLANDRHSSPDSGRGQSEEPLTTSTELPPSSNISCTSINAIPVEKRSTYVIERNERKRNYNHSDETDDPNSADALRQAARMVLSASRPSSVAYQTPVITHDSPTVTNTLDAAHVLGLPSFAPIAASALAAATQHVNGYEPLKERVSRLPPPKVKLETKIPTTSTTSIPEMKREPSFVTSKIPSLGPKLPSSAASPITKEAKISRLPPPQIHAASPNQTYLPVGPDSSMTRSFPASNTVLTSYQELTHKSYSSGSMPITTTTGVVSPASKIPPPKLERMSSTLSTVSVSSSRESRIPPPQVHATPPEPSRTLSASRLPAPSVKMPPTLTNMTSSSSASATTTTSTSRLPVASYSKSRLVADSTSLARQTNLPSAWSKAERST